MVDRAPILFACGILALLGAVTWTSVWAQKARNRAEAYCQEHLMVLVDTPAGERCAPLWALERTSR